MGVDIDERKVQRNEFGMWLAWTLATAVGMLLGLTPQLLVVEYLPLWLVRILTPLIAGFLVGIFQWVVLRNYLEYSQDWILNVGAGWGLGFALGLVIIQTLNKSLLGAILGYILFGVIIALVQWPVLRREVPHVVTWVLASVVGWALGAVLSQVILDLLVTGNVTSQVLSTSVISGFTGLIAGAITGVALVWIVRQPELGDEDYQMEGKDVS